ncbi:MAG: hypothetical protein IPL33_21695 [Sphingobacteriales bacterium]|nr:hypothetical protein [Sphingobacteriales bacterium]
MYVAKNISTAPKPTLAWRIINNIYWGGVICTTQILLLALALGGLLSIEVMGQETEEQEEEQACHDLIMCFEGVGCLSNFSEPPFTPTCVDECCTICTPLYLLNMDCGEASLPIGSANDYRYVLVVCYNPSTAPPAPPTTPIPPTTCQSFTFLPTDLPLTAADFSPVSSPATVGQQVAALLTQPGFFSMKHYIFNIIDDTNGNGTIDNGETGALWSAAPAMCIMVPGPFLIPTVSSNVTEEICLGNIATFTLDNLNSSIATVDWTTELNGIEVEQIGCDIADDCNPYLLPLDQTGNYTVTLEIGILNDPNCNMNEVQTFQFTVIDSPCCADPNGPCCIDPEGPCCIAPNSPCCIDPEGPCCTDPSSTACCLDQNANDYQWFGSDGLALGLGQIGVTQNYTTPEIWMRHGILITILL